MLLTPPGRSLFTVSVPEYTPASVGVKLIVTVCALPGAIWPLVQLRLTSELTLGLAEMLVTASAALPLFVIVSVVDLVVPTVTSPRARLPLSVMTRVDVVGDVGRPESESLH